MIQQSRKLTVCFTELVQLVIRLLFEAVIYRTVKAKRVLIGLPICMNKFRDSKTTCKGIAPFTPRPSGLLPVANNFVVNGKLA